MNTVILLIVNFKVENVCDAISAMKTEIANYVGRRSITENNTGLPAVVTNCLLEVEDKSQIMEFGATHNVGVVFVETDYTVMHGSTLKTD